MSINQASGIYGKESMAEHLGSSRGLRDSRLCLFVWKMQEVESDTYDETCMGWFERVASGVFPSVLI